MSTHRPGHEPIMDPVEALHRQQLSALIDGELEADQARFLIRRLEHDQALCGCQERWQIAGDVLRGQLGAVAPVDFAARVAAALPASAAAPIARRGVVRRWQWAAGGALAAGLALLAVTGLPRPAGPDMLPAQPQLATTPVSPEPGRQPAAAELPAAPGTTVVAVAAPAAAAAAAAAAPAQPRRPAARPARAKAPAAAPPSAAPADVQLASADGAAASPFALPAVEPSPRPWPRSDLAGGDPRLNVRLPAASASPFAAPVLRDPAGWPEAPAD